MFKRIVASVRKHPIMVLAAGFGGHGIVILHQWRMYFADRAAAEAQRITPWRTYEIKLISKDTSDGNNILSHITATVHSLEGNE
ncbi:hypothetical protein HOY80DRAFT_1134086 [Tuber brumale]|nr:hypothetical protein HOY80DRAFT_1134086 [Tuber brumale]